MKWMRKAVMSQLEMEEKLSFRLRKKISLHLHENRSVFLRYEESPFSGFLRLHRFFLHASEDVIGHLISYLSLKKRRSLGYLRLFLQQPLFSKKAVVDRKKMKGICYDLEKIYHIVEARDLPEQISLAISWFQEKRRKKVSSVTYGFFCRNRHLIAINQWLDNEKVPQYFLEYVIYHEALHAIFPPVMDARGNILVHTKAFRAKEKQFPYIKEALTFQKKFFQQAIQENAQYGRT